jgi:hypothetical protein
MIKRSFPVPTTNVLVPWNVNYALYSANALYILLPRMTTYSTWILAEYPKYSWAFLFDICQVWEVRGLSCEIIFESTDIQRLVDLLVTALVALHCRLHVLVAVIVVGCWR